MQNTQNLSGRSSSSATSFYPFVITGAPYNYFLVVALLLLILATSPALLFLCLLYLLSASQHFRKLYECLLDILKLFGTGFYMLDVVCLRKCEYLLSGNLSLFLHIGLVAY